MTEQNAHSYLQSHTIRKDVLQFDLPREDEGVRQEAQATSGRTAGKTLVKDGMLRVAIVALEKGDALDHHETNGPCSIQVMRGRIKVATGSGDLEVGPGGLIALDAGTEHDAVALEDSGVLVTVAMT